MFNNAGQSSNDETLTFNHLPILIEEVENMRWFLMPNEAHHYLTGQRVSPLTNSQLAIKEYVPKPRAIRVQVIPRSTNSVQHHLKSSSKNMSSSMLNLTSSSTSGSSSKHGLKSLIKRTAHGRIVYVQPSNTTVTSHDPNHTTHDESIAQLNRMNSVTFMSVERPDVIRSSKRWQSSGCLDSIGHSIEEDGSCGEIIDLESSENEDIGGSTEVQSSMTNGVTRKRVFSKKRRGKFKALKHFFKLK